MIKYNWMKFLTHIVSKMSKILHSAFCTLHLFQLRNILIQIINSTYKQRQSVVSAYDEHKGSVKNEVYLVKGG